MKEIKMLAEYIEEEIEDAEKYARAAHKAKEKDPKAMTLFEELSKQELKHADMLHERAKQLIKDFEASGGEAPKAMMIIWEWEHEKIIDKAAKVRRMLDMLHG